MIFFSEATEGVGRNNPIKGPGGDHQVKGPGSDHHEGLTKGQGSPKGEPQPGMGGLRAYLVQQKGDEGEKLFQFIQNSIVMMSIQQVQHAADRAKKAAKEARQQQ